MLLLNSRAPFIRQLWLERPNDVSTLSVPVRVVFTQRCRLLRQTQEEIVENLCIASFLERKRGNISRFAKFFMQES